MEHGGFSLRQPHVHMYIATYMCVLVNCNYHYSECLTIQISNPTHSYKIMLNTKASNNDLLLNRCRCVQLLACNYHCCLTYRLKHRPNYLQHKQLEIYASTRN